MYQSVWICWLILSWGAPEPAVSVYHVDVIDRNRMLCREISDLGRETIRVQLDQVIFWDWHPPSKSYRCTGYVLAGVATIHPRGNGAEAWVTVQGRQVRIRSESYRESWTWIDPERADAAVHPEGDRLFRGILRLSPVWKLFR